MGIEVSEDGWFDVSVMIIVTEPARSQESHLIKREPFVIQPVISQQ